MTHHSLLFSEQSYLIWSFLLSLFFFFLDFEHFVIWNFSRGPCLFSGVVSKGSRCVLAEGLHIELLHEPAR